jgi:hypothetical protein
VTVVGWRSFAGRQHPQLYGDQISRGVLGLLEADEFTYNGSRFDLPLLRQRLGLTYAAVQHTDLMYKCWLKTKGGLKVVGPGHRAAAPDMNDLAVSPVVDMST